MLIIKDGLELPVEVVDPEAVALIKDGEWREATASQAQALADYYTANPDATSHDAKVKAAAEAGLDADLAQPATVVHQSPQLTPEEEQQALEDADPGDGKKAKKGKKAQADSPENEFPEG